MNERVLKFSLALTALFLSTDLKAQITWNGSSDSFWSQSANWSSQAPANNGSGTLVFDPANLAGSLITTMVNDLLNFNATGITIDNSAQGTSYSISGNQLILGGNFTTLGSSGTTGHTLSLDLILNGNRTFTLSDLNQVTVSGIIGQSGGNRNLIKAGTGTLRLEAANTFGGQVQINGGTLVATMLSDTGIASSLGTGSGIPAIRIGLNGTGGTLRYEGAGSSLNRQVQIGAGVLASHTGSATIDHFGTGALVFTAPVFNLAQSDATAARNLFLGGDNISGNEIQGVIQNNSGLGGVVNLVKSDTGLWRLSGENTFSGRVTIQAGNLEVDSLSDLGAAGSLGTGLTDGTIRIGANQTDATLTYIGADNLSTNRDFLIVRNATLSNNGAGAVSFSAANFNVAHVTTAARSLILSGTNEGANLISGVIQDNSTGTIGVAKGGTGAWSLLNAANTYSGPVQINVGTLRVAHLSNAGQASSLGTGLAGSVIRIGNANSTGTLSYLGSGSSTDRQIQIGNGATQVGGAIVENVGTGALLFTNPVFNTVTTTAGTRTLTLGGSNADANEIQGTIQNNDTGLVNLLKIGSGSWTLSGTNTYTGATTVDGGVLKISPGAGLASQNVTIRQGTLDLRNASQTLGNLGLGIATAASAAKLQIAAGSVLTTTGNLTHTANTAGLQSIIEGDGSIDILQVTGTRTWTVGDSPGAEVDLLVTAALTASANTGNRILNKAGEGILELAGNNALGNITSVRVSAGGLRIAATGNLNGVGTAEIRQGSLDIRNSGQVFAAVILGNATAGNGSSQLVIGPGVTLDLGGNLSYLADDDVANTAIISGGELRLTGNRTVAVADNPAISGSELIISSIVGESGGARVLTKTGDGTLRLDAAATYTGGTVVGGGTLQLGVDQAIPATGPVSVNGSAAAGTLDLNGKTLTVETLTLGGTITTVPGLAHRVIDSAGGGILTLSGNVAYNAGSVGFENGQASLSSSVDLGSAARTFTVADSPNAPVDLHISGIVSGNQIFTKAGSGVLYLSGDNTFSGQIGVNAGTLRVSTLSDQGSTSSLGTGLINSLIRLGNQGTAGVLEYVGDGDATNRPIQLGAGTAAAHTGGATVLNNGAGALEFTAASFNTAVNTGAGTPGDGRVLTIGGTNADANRIVGIIRNNNGTFNAVVSVVKQDAGLWILEGNNNYSGTTTINGGTLRVEGNQTAATGAVFVNEGGTLAGTGVIGGSTSVAAGGTLTGGTAGTVGTIDFSGNLTAQSGSFWLVDLVSDVNQSADLVRVAGSLHLGGASLQLNSLGAFVAGNTYVIAQYGGNLTGTFAGLAEGDVIGGQYLIGYGSGSNGVITLTAVPEPPAILSFVFVLLLSYRLWGRRRSPCEIPA